jgi:steroid delta-isomerase-like uncharacterized protein
MSEQNKMLVTRGIEEVWNRGNYDLVDEFVAGDFVGHSSMGETHGPEEAKQFWMSLRAAFPDLAFSIEDQIAEGDKVVTRWSSRATHTSDFRGIPATGKQGHITGITIHRIVNGKVVEGWTNLDELGLMQQLGVIPAPAPAGA